MGNEVKSGVSLRDLAAQVDAGELDGDAIPRPGPTPAPREEKPEATQPAEETSKTDEAQPGEEQQPSPGTDPSPGQPGDKDKKDSKYTRAAKSEERLTKSWAELNAEKEALKREREELERLRGQAPQASQPGQEKIKPGHDGTLRDEHGRTAKEYADAAEAWESSGDPEELKLAKVARQRAAELGQAEQAARVNTQRETHRQAWTSNVEKTMKAPGNEDLDNPDSPLAKTVLQALQEIPAFTLHPDGFAAAVKYAKGVTSGARVTDLEAQVAKLQKDLESANAKLQPHGRSVTTPPNVGTPVSKLPAEKRGATLRKMARELDAAGVGIG